MKNRLSFNKSKKGDSGCPFLNLFIMKEKNNISKKVKFTKEEQAILDRFLILNPNIKVLIRKFNLEPVKSSTL